MANKLERELDNEIKESDFEKIPVLFHTLSLQINTSEFSIYEGEEVRLNLKPSFYKYV